MALEKLGLVVIGDEMAKNAVHEIEVAGVTLNLKSPLSDEQVRAITALVDEQMTAILNQSKGRSIQNAAIVTALNLAEELLAVKELGQSQLDKFEKRLNKISQKMDRSIEQRASMTQ